MHIAGSVERQGLGAFNTTSNGLPGPLFEVGYARHPGLLLAIRANTAVNRSETGNLRALNQAWCRLDRH